MFKTILFVTICQIFAGLQQSIFSSY